MSDQSCRIAKIDAIPLEIPFSPFALGEANRLEGWAGNKWTALSTLLVRVETEAGIVGWGEGFSYNCLRPLKAVVEDMIAPSVIGRDARDIRSINEDLQRSMHLWGRYGITIFGLSGLDIALWDILGKATGTPVSGLLGGTRRKSIPGYASLFRYGNAETVAERSRAALQDGYGILKLHEITEPAVRAARDVAGGDVPITVDTNCPWTPREARDEIAKLKPYDPYWIEEPLFPPEDFEALASLQRDCGVPLAAGENACTAVEFGHMLQAGAVSFAQPSVTKVGGITEFSKVVTLTGHYGTGLMPHSPYFGPGFIATLHLLASIVPHGWLERFYLDVEASLYEGWTNPDKDGSFSVPDGPGLGIDPNPDVIRDYHVKSL